MRTISYTIVNSQLLVGGMSLNYSFSYYLLIIRKGKLSHM